MMPIRARARARVRTGACPRVRARFRRHLWGSTLGGLLSSAIGGCSDSPPTGTCEAHAGLSALSEGFSAPRIELTKHDDGTWSFDPAAEAVYSTCASFRCPPCVAPQGSLRADAQLFPPQLELTNFDACVVSYEHIVSEHPRFALDDLRLTPDAYTCEPATATEPSDVVRRTAAWVGCWVYGPTRIIETTEFVPLPPQPTLIEDCADSDPDRPRTEGSACRRSDEQGVGHCVDDSCEAQCLESP